MKAAAPGRASLLVELEGVEPSSKRGSNELSTCVVSAWFLCYGRSGRPTVALVSLVSGPLRDFSAPISDIHAPPGRLVSEKGQSGDVSCGQLLVA